MHYPKRKPTRYPEYDYATPGYYFVTICTYEKRCLLGRVEETQCGSPTIMILNDTGKMVNEAILYIDRNIDNCEIDHYVIMPNHIHLIVKLNCGTGGDGAPPLHNVVGRLKSYTANQYKEKLWQRSFHDHIIRGELDYLRIWNYVEYNPEKWLIDTLYTES